MKFPLGIRVILTSGFLLLSLASGVFITVASLNYIQLYPAVSQLTIGVARMGFVTSSTAERVVTRLVVNNTVGYSGLRITKEILSIFFSSASNSSDTIFKDAPLSDSSNSIEQVAPNAQTAWEWTISIPPVNASSMASFYTSHNQNLIAHYSLSMDVANFLSGLGGTVTLQRDGQVPLVPG